MKIQSAKAGIGTGRAGLQAASGLFSSAGLFQKGVKSFNPLDLDPYLLFDAETSMLGTLEAETLDLDPANLSSLDVITATRSGVATRTLSNGTIALAPSDTVRVDYTLGEQLTPTKFQNIGYTDFANSYWTARGFTKVGTVDGPLGYTGYEFLENDSNSNPGVYINSNLSDGSPMTFGVWLKASSPISVALATTGAVKTSTINITTDWQFFSCTDSTNTNTGPHIGGFATITQGSGVTLFAAMPQLEEGTTASSFVANTTGSPLWIASPTFGPRVPMILVEPSATNLLTYSEDFSHSSWTKLSVLIDNNQTEAPNGSISAHKLIESGNNNHLLYTTAGNALGTISVYAKQADANNRLFQIRRDGGSSSWAWFDLQAGTVESQTQGVALIEDAGNGWFRCAFTPTNSDSTVVFGLSNGSLARSVSYEADGTSGVYIWGAQLEESSVPTSYIPTSGSTVTRAADDLVISGSDFTDFYNQSEGTFYFEGVPQNLTDDTIYWMDMSPSNERIAIYDGPSYNVRFFVENIESVSAPYYPPNQLARLAISFKSNAQELSVNGGTSVTLTNNSLPSPTSLHIGSRYSLGNHLNGHIKRLIYWPTHSDNL